MSWVVHQFGTDWPDHHQERCFGPYADLALARRVAGRRRRELGLVCRVLELEPPPGDRHGQRLVKPGPATIDEALDAAPRRPILTLKSGRPDD